MNIEWKEINPDYIVSSDGQVGSRRRGGLVMLKCSVSAIGYPVVSICVDGGTRRLYVHRLVAEAFIGPPLSPKHEVNHKNGNKADNRDVNLEWVTGSQNVRHSFDVLGHVNAHGERNGRSKLTEARVRDIRWRLKAGASQRQVAAAHNVSRGTVRAIADGKSWAWLT